MLRDDILMRQIRRMVDALLHVVSLQKKGEHTQVLDETDDLLHQQLGLKVQLAERMSLETLEMVLSIGGKIDLDRSLLCGALLANRVVSHRARGSFAKAEQVSLLVKGLCLASKEQLQHKADSRSRHEENEEDSQVHRDRLSLLSQMEKAIKNVQ